MRKGFTLVEMLSVIVVLGIIALIAFPAVDSAIKDSRQKAYDKNVEFIEKSATTYSVTNDLGYSEEYKTLSLQTLKDAGLLKDEDIINPKDGTVMSGCVLYKWVTGTNQYIFEYSATCTIPE